MDRERLKKLLSDLYGLQSKWCGDCVDDPEDLMNDIPSFIDYAVKEVEEILAS